MLPFMEILNSQGAPHSIVWFYFTFVFFDAKKYRPFLIGTFMAKGKHYNLPPLTVMWMNLDSSQFSKIVLIISNNFVSNLWQ